MVLTDKVIAENRSHMKEKFNLLLEVSLELKLSG